MRRNIWLSEEHTSDSDALASDNSERTDQNRRGVEEPPMTEDRVFGDGNSNHLMIATDIGVAYKVPMKLEAARNDGDSSGGSARPRRPRSSSSEGKAARTAGGQLPSTTIRYIRRSPHIKQKEYDGSTPIETFLR